MRRLPNVAARLEAEIEKARRAAGQPFDPMLIQPLFDDQSERSATIPPCLETGVGERVRSPTLEEAYARYITDPTRSWSPTTREAYETSRRLAIAVIDRQMPISSLGRAHCRDLMEVLRFLPTNAGKLFPKLSPREASERARLQGDIKIISPANASSLMSNISSFLNWAVNEELIVRNPARGLRLPDAVAKRDKRLPFAPSQLKAIFNAPLYRGCADGLRGYSKPGNEQPRNARFWVPLIGLHTGARLGEICQLDTSDVRVIDGIACLAISERSLGGSTDKRLKTGASDRIIPIHPKLISCGFLDFAEKKRRSQQIKLFDDIDIGTTGSRSVAFSKWFTQFLRSCNAKQRLTCFIRLGTCSEMNFERLRSSMKWQCS